MRDFSYWTSDPIWARKSRKGYTFLSRIFTELVRPFAMAFLSPLRSATLPQISISHHLPRSHRPSICRPLISTDTLTLLSIICCRVYATRWQPIRRMRVKHVIRASTAESVSPLIAGPSASVDPAIMRAPIVRKVGCFTAGCLRCLRQRARDAYSEMPVYAFDRPSFSVSSILILVDQAFMRCRV